jgi:hypothetical protein
MALTPAQKALVKTAVEADTTMNAIPHTADGAYEIADILSSIALPDFIVWKTNVDPNEVMKNGMDWTRLDNLSIGKARIWDWLTALGSINASKLNVRAGIDAAWVGTDADLAVRAAVYVHCKRKANRLEKILATGAGSDASPATMDYEGRLSYTEVFYLMGW